MIVRKLSIEDYLALRKGLMENAHRDPLDAGFTVDLQIAGVDYSVKLLTAGHRQWAVTQAYII